MIVEKINQYLAEEGKEIDRAIAWEVGQLAQWSFEQQFMTDRADAGPGKIWLSAVGKCSRQIAYAFHGYEKKGKEIDARSKLTFFAGDIVELAITQLAKTALKKYGGGSLVATGKDQAYIKFPVNGAVISGKPDGLYLEAKEILLLECKSMPSYRFKDFQAGNLDDSYLAQINSYMEALGIGRCIVVGYNKDANVLHELIVNKSDEIVTKCRNNILAVLHSEKEKLPEPPKEYAPNDQGLYPWQCYYCSYWGHCRTNAEKVLVRNSYKLKEKQNGDGIQGQDAKSGSGNQQMGAGVRPLSSDVGKSGRPQKNRVVRGNVKASGRKPMESGSQSANIGGLQKAS